MSKTRPTIAAWWSEFERRTIRPEAGPVQRCEMRNAFYAGAAVVMRINMMIGESDVSDDEGMAILSRLDDELAAFRAALQAELQTEERNGR